MKTRLIYILVFFALTLCFENAVATTYTWNGASTGNWNDATKWKNGTTGTTNNGYPASSADNAIFSNSNVTVTFPISLTVNTISTPTYPVVTGINIQFTGTGTTLTVATISLAQTTGTALTFSSGTGATGIVSVTSGLSSYYGGSILISANTTLNVSAGITIDFTNNQANVTNNGTVNFASGCTFKLGFASTFYNNGTVNAVGTIFTTTGSQSPINNTGVFNATASSQININDQYSGVTNSGASAVFNLNASSFSIISSTGGNSGNITNSSGATFTANNNSTITIHAYQAYIKNSATFQAGTSNSPCTITINGQGASSGNTSIVNTGTFTVGSTSIINLTGTDPYNPIIMTNTSPGTFTFQSDNYGTGALGPLGAGSSATGNFTVQRYLTGGTGYRGYRLLSSPVYAGTDSYSNNVYSINYLKNSMYLTGTTGSSGGFDVSPTVNNPTLYLYRENLAPLYTTFLNSNFIGISSIANGNATPPTYSMNDGTYTTASIPVGSGYLCFFRGNRASATIAVEAVSTYTAAPTATLSTTGKLNQGAVTVSDWYTPSSDNLGYTTTSGSSSIEGFNLVGNPYPSTIDWNTYSTTSSTAGIYAPGVGNTIYILNPVNQTYATYQSTGTSVNGGSRYIPSGQGFFVQVTPASTTASLTFNEAAKPSTNLQPSTLLLSAHVPQTTDEHLRLSMKLDSVNYEETYIGFNSTASTAYVFNEDAVYKVGNSKVNLCNRSSDNTNLAINQLPFPKQSTTIPLYVNAAADGLYSLNLTEAVNIPQLYDVWLMDAYKKDSLDIKHNPNYNFNVALADTNSYGSKRFSLVIRQNAAYAYKLLSFTGAKVTGGSQLNWTTQNEDTNTGFSLQRSTDGGKTYVVIDSLQSTGAGSYSYLDASPAPGVNLYRLLQNDLNGNITYSNVVQLVYPANGNNLNGALSLYPNPASSVINLAILATSNASASYTISIINSTGNVIKTATCQQATWQSDISGLTPGVYIMQVINNADKTIVGTNKFIKL